MVGLPVVSTYLQGVGQRFGFTDNPNYDPARAGQPQDPNYPINPNRPRGWGNGTDNPDDPNNSEVQRSLICTMFGVCRNEAGDIVLDPTAGGVYGPRDNPGGPFGTMQRAGEALGVDDAVPRIGTIALGGALIITGLILSRAQIAVNVASATGIKALKGK